MDNTKQDRIREAFDASNQGRIYFGEVVRRLMEGGVESYVVDYRSHCITCYMADDETLTMEVPATLVAIGQEFAAEEIQEAIRGAQRGVVMYPEFKRRSMQAGCIGYTCWILGRHVTYYGRKGETHVERFPS